MPTFWFVRHGESLAQLDQWTGPDSETPLSTLGERQADALADEIAALPVQRVLVSPYLRARQTAERAMAKWGQAPASHPGLTPFQIIDDLRERNSGDWLANFRSDPDINAKMAGWDFVPPNGESIQQATTRAIRTLGEFESGHNTAIFAHGRILAGVLALVDARDLREPIHALDNCLLYRREISPGAWDKLLAKLA